jgi:nucleotide-binding universal stress UspA family protein
MFAMSMVVPTSLTEMSTDTRLVEGRHWARQAVDRCAEILKEAGLTAEPVVEQGDPKHVLLDEAEHWPADCVFVGAHGMSRFERVMLGSVSAAVAERAHCSVEIVRHPGGG